MSSDLATKLIASPIRTIYVYSGDECQSGVAVDSAALPLKLFSEIIDQTFTLKPLFASQFHPHKWDPASTLLWLPGGHATDFEKQIGSQSPSLRSFWEKGGRVVCVCGSAYWQSAERTYDFVTRKNPNALFSGGSAGPLLQGMCRLDWQGAALQARLVGGGFFVGDKLDVLAYYADYDTPAVVRQISNGGGVVVLTHPHPEYERSPLFTKIIESILPASSSQ